MQNVSVFHSTVCLPVTVLNTSFPSDVFLYNVRNQSGKGVSISLCVLLCLENIYGSNTTKIVDIYITIDRFKIAVIYHNVSYLVFKLYRLFSYISLGPCNRLSGNLFSFQL